MRVIYHNWSATKQRPHPQSVAEISKMTHVDKRMNPVPCWTGGPRQSQGSTVTQFFQICFTIDILFT